MGNRNVVGGVVESFYCRDMARPSASFIGRRRGISAALVGFAASLMVGACGLLEPKVTLEYEPPVLPVTVSIDTKGEVSFQTSGLSRVTPLGRFEVKPGLSRDLAGSGTVVVIRHLVNGATVDDTFELAGKTAFLLCLDGRFTQEISQEGARTSVTLTVAPGVRQVRLIDRDQPGGCSASVPPGTVVLPNSPGQSPAGVARTYVEQVIGGSENAGRSLECANGDLAAVRDLAASIEQRQTAFNAKITVAVGRTLAESTAGDQATVRAELILTAHELSNGAPRSQMAMSFSFGLRRESGWKVCTAER